MEFETHQEKSYTSNKNKSQSFQHFEQNFCQSTNANCISDHNPNISNIDLECSLFMDETSEDLDNYLNTPLPECSKYFSGNDDFECETMNHLSRNIKGKYHKKLRRLKRNNKFFKSKTVESNSINSNEIPVINEAIRKIFGPIVDKPNIKSFPKVSLKTYSNRYKRERDIVESFGLPDEPLVSLFNQCVKTQDSVNLDVDEGNLNSTLLPNPFSIYSHMDVGVNEAVDFRRSFLSFENIVPSISDSLENEVKEGFHFEESNELENPVVPVPQMIVQGMFDKTVREPKIFLEPINLDDHEVFRANDLSPITNKKKLLFQRLRSYYKNIEESQVTVSNSPEEANTGNEAEKNNTIFRDTTKSFPNCKYSKRFPRTLKRRSARLLNNEKISPSHLDVASSNSHIVTKMQNINFELITASSLFEDGNKLGQIYSNPDLPAENDSNCNSVDNVDINMRILTVGHNNKKFGHEKIPYNKYNSSDILLSPKRITRQSVQNLVTDVNTKPSRVCEVRKMDVDDENIVNILKTPCLNDLKISENALHNTLDEKKIMNKSTKTNIFMGNTLTNVATNVISTKKISNSQLQSNITSLTSVRRNHNTQFCEKEEHFTIGSINNDEVSNDKFTNLQISPVKSSSVRRSRRGMRSNLDEGCKEVETIIPQSSLECLTDSKDFSSKNQIEDHIKLYTHSNTESSQKRSHQDGNLSGKHNLNKIKRTSDRLRSKFVQSLTRCKELRIKEKASLVKDFESDDKTTASLTKLKCLHMEKDKGSNSRIWKGDQSNNDRNSINDIEILNHLKSPRHAKNNIKKISESNEIHFIERLGSSKHNSEMIKYPECSKLNKNGKSKDIKSKVEKYALNLASNDNHTVLSGIEFSAYTETRKKKLNSEKPEQISGVMNYVSNDLKINTINLKSPKKNNKAKDLYKVNSLSDSESSKGPYDSKRNQKIMRYSKLPGLNDIQENKLFVKESSAFVFASQETFKRETRSTSPKKRHQKDLKLVDNIEVNSIKGNEFRESFNEMCDGAFKLRKCVMLESPKKNPQENGNELSVSSEECIVPNFLFNEQIKQNILNLPDIDIIEPKKKYLTKSSEIKTSETELGVVDEKFMFEVLKLPSSAKKGDENGVKLCEMVNGKKPITSYLLMMSSKKKKQKKAKKFRELLVQPIDTSFSSKVNEILSARINCNKPEEERITKFCEKEINSHDLLTVGDSSKSSFISEIINKNVISLNVNQEPSNFSNKELGNDIQQKKLYELDEVTAEEAAKNITSLESPQLPIHENFEEIFNCERLNQNSSRNNSLLFEIPTNDDQYKNEFTKRSKNDIGNCEGILDVSSINLGGGTKLSYTEQKLDDDSHRDCIPSENQLSLNLKTKDRKEIDIDLKIEDMNVKDHLPIAYFKKDEMILNDEIKLPVDKLDITFDPKFDKKAETLNHSPIMFDKVSDITYATGKQLNDGNELQVSLKSGYNTHRRTSFRKILEHAMALSRLEMDMKQTEASRLKRCRSVPHEKLNSTLKTYKTPICSSVDNTLKYFRSDKHPVTKKMEFSKVKKRLDYYADSNIPNPKRTRRSRTKSLHITEATMGSHLEILEGMIPSSLEIQNNSNEVENIQWRLEIEKDIPKKTPTSILVMGQSTNGNRENTRNSKDSNYSSGKPEEHKLADTHYTMSKCISNVEITKNVKDDEADGEVLNLSEPAMKPLDDQDTEIEQTHLENSLTKKRCMSFSENFGKLEQVKSSMRRCKSVIGRPKKKSNWNNRRQSKIIKFEDNEELESITKKVPNEFKVGDSVWGKVGNYPYWPCVIVLDPETSVFKKYKLLRKTPYYHVRFFGDKGRRAWTTHIIPYEGPDDLDKMAVKWCEGVQTSYIKECYSIKALQYNKWKNAVSEAERMKNESIESKMNFFKEIFSEEKCLLEPEEAVDTFALKSSTTKSKKKKNDKIENESEDKSFQFEKEKVSMKIDSVTSCINDVISKYNSSGDNCNLVRETEFIRKELRSKRKRKTKKKSTDISSTQDCYSDLGIELLSLPPTNIMNSFSAASSSNILGNVNGTTKKLSLENTFFSSSMNSAKNAYASDKSNLINEKILKDTHEIVASNNSLSDISSSLVINNSSGSMRTRLRSLPRIRDRKARIDFVAKSEFCTSNTSTSNSSNAFSGASKLKDNKQGLPVDQSDSESRASDNSFINSSIYQLSEIKKNLFKGVTKEKVCQMCEKSADVVKCRGPCNGDFHIRCVENSQKVTNKTISELYKKEAVCEQYQDETNKQVQIITFSSGKKLLDNIVLSPQNRETSLTETQIDRKMKEVMNQIQSNGSYNADFMELTDSGGDEFEDNLKECLKSNSNKPQKPKGVFKHVTADDISIISITEDDTVKRRSVPDSISEDSVYKCPYCTSSVVPPCFVCNSISSKKGNTSRQRCSLQKCGRFFHPECLNIWPQTQWSFILHDKRKSEAIDSFVCPRHICHTCASENLGFSIGRCPNDKLVKCLRCPATYHNSYHCVPAGSQILTTTQIVCPRHIKEKSRRPVTFNTIWCFVCSEGGNLICCETCPTSVHAECLPVSFMDDDSYICEDCKSGRFPLYDEVVWVKCGTFRWWPAIILLPSEIPANLETKPHSEGDFVVKFFGTYDYYWVGRGRTFSYQEGDTGGLNSNKSRIEEAFNRALIEAADVYRLKKESKLKRDIQVNNGLKPPSYVRIKVNRPVGNVKVFEANLSNTNSCDCDPKDPNPCGPNSNCLNRILLTECNREVCLSGSKCKNQSFEKREYPQVVPYRTEGRGWGLKTMEFIQKGQFIIEYVGEIIDDKEYQRRINRMHQQKDENYYFLTIDNNRMLDAGPKGNVARFMNHSCQPNCETQKWTVNGDTRVGLFAIKDIQADTELTFNYNLQCAGTDKKICRCGATNCRGYIGVKPGDRKPIRKRAEKKKHRKYQEDVDNKSSCFVCGRNGELVLCSNKSCLKSYHLKCVQLDSWPDRKWNCPSHNCNICSRRTIRSCVKCTSSFCPVHSNGNVRYDKELGFVCTEHDPVTKNKASFRKKSFSDMLDCDFNKQRDFSPSGSTENLISEKSASFSTRSERYRKRRNCNNEGAPSIKKIKLIN